MIYLASPYTNRFQTVMRRRFDNMVAIVAEMSRTGMVVYSPIVHYHYPAAVHKLPTDFTFWKRMNLAMIDKADELWAIQLRGWEESKGMATEMKYARGLGIPVKEVDPVSWLR